MPVSIHCSTRLPRTPFRGVRRILEYTLDDFHDLVFPSELGIEGQLCMIYNCCLDDSKDAKQLEMFVCAGFFGAKGDWSRFTSEWNIRLHQDGIGYFKTSEYRMLKK